MFYSDGVYLPKLHTLLQTHSATNFLLIDVNNIYSAMQLKNMTNIINVTTLDIKHNDKGYLTYICMHTAKKINLQATFTHYSDCTKEGRRTCWAMHMAISRTRLQTWMSVCMYTLHHAPCSTILSYCTGTCTLLAYFDP